MGSIRSRRAEGFGLIIKWCVGYPIRPDALPNSAFRCGCPAHTSVGAWAACTRMHQVPNFCGIRQRPPEQQPRHALDQPAGVTLTIPGRSMRLRNAAFRAPAAQQQRSGDCSRVTLKQL